MHHGKHYCTALPAPSPLHSITNCFAKILHHFHLFKQKPFLSISGMVSCRWIGRRWSLRLRRSPLSNSSSSRAYSLSSRSPRSRPKWPEIEIMRRASSWTATNFVAPSAFHKTTQVSKKNTWMGLTSVVWGIFSFGQMCKNIAIIFPSLAHVGGFSCHLGDK